MLLDQAGTSGTWEQDTEINFNLEMMQERGKRAMTITEQSESTLEENDNWEQENNQEIEQLQQPRRESYTQQINPEALSISIIDAHVNKNLSGILIARNGPEITDLLFADDSYFFLKLDRKSINTFHNILASFCSNSGQIINLNNSIITFCSRTPNISKQEAVNTLNISPSETFGKCLGIDLDIGFNRKRVFLDLIDKIKLRILSWKSKFLNFEGKITLIKSVLHSLLVYPMGIYKIPLGTLKEIDIILANFLWGSNNNVKKTLTPLQLSFTS
ncbi:hypothetical protein LIER_20315 [Lithospermum erythrorhizon]|uniref:Uncharacterized protein n=1 Tax=Lithospermum erythrorhizon TaxID=34254 RepID=A0AAV3QNT2_LITER